MKYLFKKIEPKWQAKWEEAKVFEAKDNSDKPKFYGLVEFPYPSGAGMHVGHIKAYSSLEVISRKRHPRRCTHSSDSPDSAGRPGYIRSCGCILRFLH